MVPILSEERRFHLLRHFRDLSAEYLARELCGADPEVARAQTRIPGSKFLPAFAADPDQALARVIDEAGHRLPPFGPDGRLTVSVSFPPARFPDGIGTDGLIALQAIPPGTPLEREERSGRLVMVVTMEPPLSWEAHLILVGDEAGEVRVLTLFPGTLAPPFPDPTLQGPAEVAAFAAFWEGHALVADPGGQASGNPGLAGHARGRAGRLGTAPPGNEP